MKLPGFFSDLTQPRVCKHRVAVVSCGKEKRASACAARDLYTGDLSSKGLRWAGQLVTEGVVDAWFILSAGLGVVAPDQQVAPYDTTLADLDRDSEAYSVWRRGVWDGFIAWCTAQGWDWRDVEMVMVTGSDYLDVFCGRIPQLWPMDGLGIGERKAFLKKELMGAKA